MSSLTITEKKEEPKKEKAKAIVKPDAVVSTKTPVIKKMANSFIEEGARDIKNYIVDDVLIPGIKETILNILSMAFFGESSDYSRRSRRDDRRSYTEYSSYYGGRSRRSERSDRRSRREDVKADYKNIILKTREDAEDVVEELYDRIKKNGDVSVAEFLEMVNAPSDFPDNNWGWTDERDIDIRRVRDGWLIDVERARYIGN